MKAMELFKNKPPMQQRAGVLCSIYAPYLYSYVLSGKGIGI